MRTRLSIVLATALLCSAVFAGEAVSNLKADLDTVVSSGVVSPVDGITAAGQPDEAALKVFADQGYTTVIDLRTAGEDRGMDESAVIESLEMDYVALPIGRDGITFDNARKLDALIADADGPVLLHCGSSNRVGALLALRKSLGGSDDDVALEYGREGGLTSLEGKVKEALASD